MSIEFSRPIKINHIDGKRLEFITATPDECVALASRLNIIHVNTLSAEVKLGRQDDRMRYHVRGSLEASITQECAISGDDVESAIHENFEAWFIDQDRVASFAKAKEDKHRDEESDEYEMRDEKDDPERITGGAIDIGELTAQYLALAIDPYPRAEGVEEGDYIEVKAEDKPNPFAKLVALKEKK